MKKYILLILMFITSIGYSQKSVIINASSEEPTVKISDYLYVSQSDGNNSTAQRGDLKKMYADPWAAVDAANEGDIIQVLDGNYTLDTIGGSAGNVFFPVGDLMASSLIKKNITIKWEEGSGISSVIPVSIPIFYDTVGYDFKMIGDAVLDYRIIGGNDFWGRIGPYGNSGRIDGEFYCQVDSIIYGKQEDEGWYRAWTIGGIKSFIITGNYIQMNKHQLIRGWSNDTLHNGGLIDFKKGEIFKSDVQFDFPNIDSSSFVCNFDDLLIEVSDYPIDNTRMNNGSIIFNVTNLIARKSKTYPNQDFLVRGSYTNGTRPLTNSSYIFNVQNAIMDSIYFCKGLSNRFAGNVNNKFILNGNFKHYGVPLFSNTADANIGEDKMIYVIENSTIESYGAPTILADDLSGIYISNSFIDVKTDTTALLINFNGAVPHLTNSYIRMAVDRSPILSTLAGQTATISGSYSNFDFNDANTTIIQRDLIGGSPTVTPTTLQQAIDAQESGGEVSVSFPSFGIEDDGSSTLIESSESLTIGATTDLQLYGNEYLLNFFSEGILLQGYGENEITGIGGDYSSLRPDAIVPKGYVDNLPATTLQEAIDAQETADGGGYMYVEFPSGSYIEDDGGTFSLNATDASSIVLNSDGNGSFTIAPGGYILRQGSNFTDGILLQGFGENSGTGIGGDYSSLRPDAIVPKGYVDSTISESPTTLQEAIDAQTVSGELDVNYGNINMFVEDGGGMTLTPPNNEGFGINSNSGGLSIGPTKFALAKGTDLPWLLVGYGENSGTGIGGDYSSLRPDAIVPKAYIDSKIFEGVTDYEADSDEYVGNFLRVKSGVIEAYNGVITEDGEENVSAGIYTSTGINSRMQISSNGIISLSSANNFDFMNLQFTPNSSYILASGSSLFKGIVYSENISAKYTDRSLVDKGYVDLHDTIIVNIPCFKFNETVTTGECGFFAVPDNLIGDDIIAAQFAYATAGTGSTSDVQLADGFTGFFGATMADGDRVETVTNGNIPITMTSEQVIYVSVVSTSTVPAEGLSVNLTILKKR